MIRSCWQYFSISVVLFYLTSNAFGGAWLGTKIEMDTGADGGIDTTIYSVFDDDGTLTENRYDNNGNGVIDAVTYYTYNQNGYDQIAQQDLDADGSIDQVIYFSHTDGGNISIIEYDTNVDGTMDNFNCYAFDDVNLPSIMRCYEGSGAYDGSGTLVSISHYTYDAQCNQIQQDDDTDADGNIDEVTYNSYDDQCRLSVVKSDTNNDGGFETVSQHTYDDGGLISKTVVFNEMESYGITVKSHYIYNFTNTYDANGYATKIESNMYGTETIYGQTVEVSSHSITYTTWEYFANAEDECCPPYASECGCPNGYSEGDSGQEDAADGVTPASVGISGSFQSNDPVTVTVSGSAESAGTLYYKFYYCANYGTNAYSSSPWVVMQAYSTSNSCTYTFPNDGSYIVVVRVVTDPDNEPDNLPIIGGVVTIGDTQNPRIGQLSSNVSGAAAPDTPVTYTISASDTGGNNVYYKWFYRGGYGTSSYDTMPWVTVQEYSLSTSCEFTFPDAGDYIVVVRAVTDPGREPADLAIIGGTVACRR